MTTDNASYLFRGAIVPTAVVAVPVLVVCSVVWGVSGLAGSGLGVALVVALCGFTLVLMRLTARVSPSVAFAFAMGSYVGKVAIMAVLLVLLRGIGDSGTIALNAIAVAVCACLVTWLAGEVWAFRRLRLPVFDLSLGGSASTGAGTPVLRPRERADDSIWDLFRRDPR